MTSDKLFQRGVYILKNSPTLQLRMSQPSTVKEPRPMFLHSLN